MSTLDFDGLPDSAFIRQRQLITAQIIPFSPATLWRHVSSGRFPKPIKIGRGITAWPVGEIRQWLQNPAAYNARPNAQSEQLPIERSRGALR